jgi:hypothetical protein
MDRFLKLDKQKTPRGPRTEWLENLVKTHKKVFIWGRPGIGKTWTAKSMTLDGTLTIYDDDDDFTVEASTKYSVYIGNSQTQCPEGVHSEEYIQWTSTDTLRGSKGIFGSTDIFEEPSDIVRRLLQKEKFEIPDIAERGYMYALVHENHNTINPEILESLSNADIFDTYIYKNSDWAYTNYFISEGLLRPASLLETPSNTLVPGSIWTKHQNMCMRRKRLKSLYQKGFTLDYLPLLRDYLNVGHIHEYLEIQDIDILNHVCKVKRVQALKKQIRERGGAGK